MTRYFIWPMFAMLGWAVLGYAQEPLTPPGMPDTVVGYGDMAVKASPAFLPLLVTLGLMMLKIEAPAVMEKVPTKYLPVINLLASAGVSALTAWGSGLVMEGGIDPAVAATTGGAVGGTAQLGANKVVSQAVVAPPKVAATLNTKELPKGD